MRIRIALTLGALVLAGGALTGGIALASDAQAPTTTTRPAPAATEPPSAAPAPERGTKAPTAVPAPPREATRAPGAVRVPRAVPAGPTGDLHLPAIGVL